MRHHTKFLLAASAAILIAACEKKADDAVVAEPVVEAAAPEIEAVEPMVETATDPNQIGTAGVDVGLQSNALYFASSSAGFCFNGGCQSGIVLDTGDIDLSSFPPGDILITITLNDDAYNAGYRFPSDGWQAVAIAVDPPGDPVAPTPVFGQANWPAEFQAPAVTGDQRSVSYTDLESDENVYEYSIALDGPNGRVVMDPTVKNGGGGGNK